MSQVSDLTATMQAVMDGHQVVRQFHQNVADLFRALGHILEDAEPGYTVFSKDGKVLTASIEHALRTSKRWGTHHFCVAFEPINDESLPLVLVNVSVDEQFHPQPEIWLGVIAGIESRSFLSWEETVAYLFSDYLVPDDDWTEPGEWYEETIEDEQVQAYMSFLRFPLEQITGLDDLEQLVGARLLKRMEEIALKEDE